MATSPRVKTYVRYVTAILPTQPGLLRDFYVMPLSTNKHFETWLPICWQQSHQPDKKHARNSTLININIDYLYGINIVHQDLCGADIERHAWHTQQKGRMSDCCLFYGCFMYGLPCMVLGYSSSVSSMINILVTVSHLNTFSHLWIRKWGNLLVYSKMGWVCN